VDISSIDHVFAITNITAIYNNSGVAGTVVARLWGDSVARTWKVGAGQYLLGRFRSVTKTSTTLTTASDLIGVTGFPTNDG
jgi:hypothetical protein